MTTSGAEDQVPDALAPSGAQPSSTADHTTAPSASPHGEATPTRVMVEPAVAPTQAGTAATIVAGAALPRCEPGAVLGDYLLAERIGKGGMGEVWKAVHRRLGRTVAIKLMLHHSREARNRFEREARLASTLDHPHIAKLFEFSLEPSFIAMQYVEGVALHKATGDKIRALRDAALAVHHAHQRGVLHRDLKPDNVLVDAQGQAFVLDFGLARPVTESGEALTVTGELIGTPTFMAPEQALGETTRMDARTDVYGLGATLYAVLSGHSPFPGPSTWAVLRRVVEEDPLPPGGERDLETICLRAMAKDRDHRYQSAADFAAELTRFLERRPVLARRAGLTYRLRRSMQRRPAIWGLATALALAVTVGAAFGMSQLLASRASLIRAHQADTARLAAAAVRERELRLEDLAARSRRELDALDDTLSLQLGPAQRSDGYARLDALLARLRDEQRVQPEEGILSALAGETELLRNREQAAIGDFAAAISHADAPVSRQLGTLARAAQGQALARLRQDFFDQMANLFIFDDRSGYLSGDGDGAQVRWDLERSGQGADSYAQQSLELWARYIAAARTADPAPLYIAISQDAKRLAARGGRHPEVVLLLCGVLEPFPRTLATVEAHYNAAIDRNHNLPQLYVQRALENLADGRLAQVRDDCSQALMLDPDYALAHLMRAKALLAAPGADVLGAADAAAPDADAACRLAPRQPNAPLLRAAIRWRQGQYRLASDDFATAQRLAGELGTGYRNSGQLWSASGEFHRQLGQNARAIDDFEHAAACGDQSALQTAAELVEADGRFNTAQQLLASRLREGQPAPEDARACCNARLWRAGVRERRGDGAGALADYDWIIAHAPNYLPALTARGDVLRRAGRVAEALPLIDHAVALLQAWAAQAITNGMPAAQANQHVADALVARAAAEALLAGHQGYALSDCQEALALCPQHIEALILRSGLVTTPGASDGGADAQRAVQLLMQRGDDQRARKEFSDALVSYDQALAIHADDRARAAAASTRAQRDQAACQVDQP